MALILRNQAQKTLDGISEPLKSRILETLQAIQKTPPEGDIKKLQGRNGYRVRTGGWRILFDKLPDGTIDVYKIAPRGGAYKG
jgi:mRNA interferase RelE/StbE